MRGAMPLAAMNALTALSLPSALLPSPSL